MTQNVLRGRNGARCVRDENLHDLLRLLRRLGEAPGEDLYGLPFCRCLVEDLGYRSLRRGLWGSRPSRVLRALASLTIIVLLIIISTTDAQTLRRRGPNPQIRILRRPIVVARERILGVGRGTAVPVSALVEERKVDGGGGARN